MKLTLQLLRRRAIATSLFSPTTLQRAIDRMGFVQADSIRQPARAQDLILRHRVKNYRVGDLEKFYPTLHLEEDFLYAYGFMPQSTGRLLHPRTLGKVTAAERKVLEVVSSYEQIHPRELNQHLGSKREINAWGGYSQSTTRTLEKLHYRGLLRIAGREKGIRLYAAVQNQQDAMEADQRLRQLTLVIASILGPLSEQSLQSTLQHLAHAAPDLVTRLAVKKLVKSGDLETALVDGINYVWPAGSPHRNKVQDKVRFLAPFDPLVWDRKRFQHFWGWAYRFEAYTPAEKRKLGYYAMPMLWRDNIVGWVNIWNKPLKVVPGYVNGEVTEPAFQREFEAEVDRFRLFMAA